MDTNQPINTDQHTVPFCGGQLDGIPIIESCRLFGPNEEIMIRHQGKIYRLRITRKGKLILN